MYAVKSTALGLVLLDTSLTALSHPRDDLKHPKAQSQPPDNPGGAACLRPAVVRPKQGQQPLARRKRVIRYRKLAGCIPKLDAGVLWSTASPLLPSMNAFRDILHATSVSC